MILFSILILTFSPVYLISNLKNRPQTTQLVTSLFLSSGRFRKPESIFSPSAGARAKRRPRRPRIRRNCGLWRITWRQPCCRGRSAGGTRQDSDKAFSAGKGVGAAGELGRGESDCGGDFSTGVQQPAWNGERRDRWRTDSCQLRGGEEREG